MKTPLTVLKAARAKLPGHFVHGHFAVNAAGKGVSVCSTQAESFCMIGVVNALTPAHSDVAHQTFVLLKTLVPYGNLVYFNDNHSESEVLAVFDKAIASLESKC